MIPLFYERRTRDIMVEVDRRRPQKHIAKEFGISHANIRVIIYRYRHRCNFLEMDKQKKLA